MTICHDCDSALATQQWDCGEEHERMIGVRLIDLCATCFDTRANEELVSDPAAHLRDEMDLQK